MKRICLISLVLLVAASVFAGIVKDSGVKGGIVVQLGIGDGSDLEKLLINEKYLVQGLDTDAGKIAKARKYLKSKGLYGKITVAQYDGKKLPYVDSLVNLLINESYKLQVTSEEIMRVVAPLGVAIIKGKKITKPWPSNIGEWNHFLNGPDNNAVAKDTVVAAPKSIQWVSNPRWGRSHEELASMSATVTAKGRVFSIMDEAPNVSIRFRGQWNLTARDAFNGTLLWKRDIPLWSDHLRHFRAGPVHLPRRLAAVGDKVYVTLGLADPVSVLDAATGKTLKVYEGTERTEEITVDKGVAYLVVGTSEKHRGGSRGFFERDEPKASDFRYIAALDAESGKELWRKDFSKGKYLLPMTMTVRNGSVFYQDTEGVGRLNAKDGKDIWKTPRETLAKRMSFSAPTVVATDEMLLVADRDASAKNNDVQAAKEGKVEWGIGGWNENGFSRGGSCTLIAYSVSDGKKVWSIPCRESYNSATDVFVAGGLVYVGKDWQGYDLKTGEKKTDMNTTGEKVGMPHHRCYRNKASVNYIFTGRSGVEVVDVKKGWLVNNSWIRGTCQYGIMPANGFIYAPPDACGCFNKVRLQGYFAAAPVRGSGQVEDLSKGSGTLTKGPAYGKNPQSEIRNPKSNWPMHRADNSRSGSVKTTVKGTLQKGWSKNLSGPSTSSGQVRLTQPVIVGDTVYVAEVDAHTVHALDVSSGNEKWAYTAGGRIDSSPTIYKGMVLFGSADGKLNCLRAKDGALAWKFTVAPEDRVVASYGQLESAWPVHGSVLVQNDIIYVSAGRNSYLDGGIVLYGLDPATGKSLSRNVISSFNPQSGKQIAPEDGFDMEGVNTDILSGDGENVFMKQKRFDKNGKESSKDKPHLFGIQGFLGEEWFVRSYWLLGTDVRSGYGGWASGGGDATFGRIMVFNDENVYGYGRTMVKASAIGHKEDTYHLFGVKKQLQITGGASKKESRLKKKKGKKGKPPVKSISADQKESPPVPFWSNKDTLIVRAMALTSDKLVVAGPPDLRKKQSGLMAYSNEAESVAAFKGDKGVVLRVVNSADGKTLSENKLDAMPVFDGMSVANGKVFVSLKNGEVQCWQ
ncbi:PQQ-binding-like beta-propeller repeat protein [Verrucomicrobiota bacterium]